MDFILGDTADALRARLRDLIKAELPDGFHGAFTDDPADLEVTRRFAKRLAMEGLLVLTWPREYGGQAGSVWEQTVLREEMWAHSEPRGAQYMGLNWVGPAIMRFGTDEQKSLHLPRIAEGDAIWCQGFSEPEAGSDLASLRTKAVRDGDHWLIYGQKIWTSYAGMADSCVLAARTSASDRKQNGITIFLIPMDRDGIDVRPISSMLGPHHLNEMFLDSVVAYESEVLGKVDRGWDVINGILANERIGIARYARVDKLLSELRDEMADRWSDLPCTIKSDWVRALIQVRQARLLAYQAVAAQAAGDPAASVEASKARIAATRCDQDVAEFLFRVIGARALEDLNSGGPLFGTIEDHWRYAQAATVASGTIEIQRMIVARELIGR